MLCNYYIITEKNKDSQFLLLFDIFMDNVRHVSKSEKGIKKTISTSAIMLHLHLLCVYAKFRLPLLCPYKGV